MSEWVHVAREGEIPEGASRVVELGGVPVAVVHAAGRYFAIQNLCPHRGGPVGEGEVAGLVITCPWHGWRFDLATGRSLTNPAASVRSFETRVEAGEIQVRGIPRGVPGGGSEVSRRLDAGPR